MSDRAKEQWLIDRCIEIGRKWPSRCYVPQSQGTNRF